MGSKQGKFQSLVGDLISDLVMRAAFFILPAYVVGFCLYSPGVLPLYAISLLIAVRS